MPNLYAKTEAFVAAYGEDKLTQIVEAAGNDQPEPGLTFSHIEKHDAINWTLYGYFNHEGEEVCFVIDNGNWAGTVVRRFGDVDISPPKTRRVHVLAPGPLHLEAKPGESLEAYEARLDAVMQSRRIIFEAWRKMPWFQELERAINYDFHFSPTTKIHDYYRAKAALRGLKIECQEIAA